MADTNKVETWLTKVAVVMPPVLGQDRVGPVSVTLGTFPADVAAHLSTYLLGAIEKGQYVSKQQVCVSSPPQR